MVLLAGQAARKDFGPGTYSDRLVWMHEGTPPNIVGTYNSLFVKQFVPRLLPQYETGIIAHLEQTKREQSTRLTQTSPTIQRAHLTEEQKQRIEANRQSALRRKLDKAEQQDSRDPSQASSSPLVSTTPAQGPVPDESFASVRTHQ
jgi:hypothetical protein